MTNRPRVPKGGDSANFFSRGSRALKLVPPLNWLAVGNNRVPKGWHVLDALADDFAIDEKWIGFTGDPNGPIVTDAEIL